MPALFTFPWPTIESFQTAGGVTYRFANGNVYSWPDNVLLGPLYDPAYIETNYRADADGKPYIVAVATGLGYPTFQNLSEDFASANTIFDVIGAGKNFNSMTLHSSRYELPQDYVRLRQKIFNSKTSDFVESRGDIVPSIIPNTDWPIDCASNAVGECCISADNNDPKIIRLYGAPTFGRADLTKASLDNELMFLKKGDAVRITGEFYRESGTITGIMDLEAAYIESGPGVRILFNDLHEGRIELKWGDKPTWRQLNPVAWPLAEWTKFSMYFELDDTSAGVIQLEIDDVLVIDATGQTLPLPDAVYTRLQIGIGATSDLNGAVMYARNIEVATT